MEDKHRKYKNLQKPAETIKISKLNAEYHKKRRTKDKLKAGLLHYMLDGFKLKYDNIIHLRRPFKYAPEIICGNK